MSHEQEVSREMQSAFVDGQLDAADWTALVQRMGEDEALRCQVCELRTLKDMVKGAYAEARPRRTALPANRRGWALVAGLALVCGLAGWLVHDATDRTGATALHQIAAKGIVVHVASSRDEVVNTALQEVEDYLSDARAAGRRVRVEIVANQTGLDILRAGKSPYAKRLEKLRATYPNLTYIACHQTAERLSERGVKVKLLPGVHYATTALDEIVKRMQQGWVYIRA
jgi:hypothetical protein